MSRCDCTCHDLHRHRAFWHYDGRGLETFKSCDDCEHEHEKEFRPEILNRPYTQADVDEPIEPEDDIGF